MVMPRCRIPILIVAGFLPRLPRYSLVLPPSLPQKNLDDGEGQLAVEGVFSNPEPSLTILHRCKDISRCDCARMDDYHRSLLQSNVTHGRMGQMPCDIVRRDIDLKAQLGQNA